MISCTLSTPDGPFTVLADDSVVLASGWTDRAETVIARVRPAHRPSVVTPVRPDDARIRRIRAAVEAYYAGEIAAINAITVRQFGTASQLRGWAQLREIKPGKPLSYSQFAATLGTPSAVRAAASICARNAPALFVPCHRVLRGDGSLGGFAWGLEVKRSLLEREVGPK